MRILITREESRVSRDYLQLMPTISVKFLYFDCVPLVAARYVNSRLLLILLGSQRVSNDFILPDRVFVTNPIVKIIQLDKLCSALFCKGFYSLAGIRISEIHSRSRRI